MTLIVASLTPDQEINAWPLADEWGSVYKYYSADEFVQMKNRIQNGTTLLIKAHGNACLVGAESDRLGFDAKNVILFLSRSMQAQAVPSAIFFAACNSSKFAKDVKDGLVAAMGWQSVAVHGLNYSPYTDDPIPAVNTPIKNKKHTWVQY